MAFRGHLKSSGLTETNAMSITLSVEMDCPMIKCNFVPVAAQLIPAERAIKRKAEAAC